MNTDFISKLGLRGILKIDGDFVAGRGGTDLENMITDDVNVINYRLDALGDLFENEELFKAVEELLPDISVLKEARAQSDKTGADSDTELMYDNLYTIRDLNIYVRIVTTLYETISSCDVKSELFNNLKKEIIRISGDKDFDELQKSMPKSNDIITSLQSITVGINLDKALQPTEAGIVSLNREKFKSGNIVDKVMRLDFGNDYQCLAPLVSTANAIWSEQERHEVTYSIHGALYKVLKSSFRQWRPAIKLFLSQKTGFLVDCCSDLRFLVSAVKLCRSLKELGYPVCRPVVKEMSEKKFTVKGAYNPALVLGGLKIIGNDISFGTEGDESMIYIFTGANGGGKTVFMETVGVCQALFQMGVFVPAEYAEISPASEILVHSASAKGTFSQSRFTEECERLSKTMDLVDKDAMVLCDEALSGTSAFEAAAIAEMVLQAMSAKACRGIFITHIHELAALPEKINALDVCVSKMGNLSVETDEATGKRTYKTVRGKGAGKSFASDIAEKYGLSFEQLMSRGKSVQTNA